MSVLIDTVALRVRRNATGLLQGDIMVWRSLALAVALGLGNVQHGHGQNRYEMQVRHQLTIVETFAATAGFETTHEFYVSSLNGDGEDSFRVELQEGVDYRIVTFCDIDCSDVDLYLYDENDHLIDSDTGIDKAPILSVTPAWTGPFQIRVRMYACSQDPCYFGIGVFGSS